MTHLFQITTQFYDSFQLCLKITRRIHRTLRNEQQTLESACNFIFKKI